jgi:hypothetical protein
MLAIRPVILASCIANDFRIRRALDSLLISAKSITGDEIAGEDIAARVHTLRHLRKQVGPRRVTGGFTRLQRARGLGTLVCEDGKSYSCRRNDARRSKPVENHARLVPLICGRSHKHTFSGAGQKVFHH